MSVVNSVVLRNFIKKNEKCSYICLGKGEPCIFCGSPKRVATLTTVLGLAIHQHNGILALFRSIMALFRSIMAQ